MNTLGRIVEEALEANKLDKSAVDWLVPHQANMRIIQATARKLDLPMERVIVTVQEHGNTFCRLGAIGTRRRCARRAHQAGRSAIAGSVWWRLYLGAAVVRY